MFVWCHWHWRVLTICPFTAHSGCQAVSIMGDVAVTSGGDHSGVISPSPVTELGYWPGPQRTGQTKHSPSPRVGPRPPSCWTLTMRQFLSPDLHDITSSYARFCCDQQSFIVRMLLSDIVCELCFVQNVYQMARQARIGVRASQNSAGSGWKLGRVRLGGSWRGWAEQVSIQTLHTAADVTCHVSQVGLTRGDNITIHSAEIESLME